MKKERVLTVSVVHNGYIVALGCSSQDDEYIAYSIDEVAKLLNELLVRPDDLKENK